MSAPKNLSELPADELQVFFDSFDYVLSDVDGVILIMHKVFDGVKESIAALKNMGKKVKYITNNSSVTREMHAQRLVEQGIEADRDDFINPSRAVIDYFKEIDFQKKVYLISFPAMMEEFKSAGINVANEYKPEIIEVSAAKFVQNALNLDKDIGAVVVCFDFNLTYLAINRAFSYILNPDCLFITTGYDKKLIFAPGKFSLGPSYFHDLLKSASGREPLALGKPQADFANYVKKTVKSEPKRTLYIGDSLQQDIHFANDLGYTTLLVLSGNATLEDMNSCLPVEKPDYYIDHLGSLHKLLKKTEL